MKAVRPLSPEGSAYVRAHYASRIMTSMLALKWKEDGDASLPAQRVAKARWAIRGCGDPDLKEPCWDKATQSPTLSIEARHLILQLLASNNWKMCLGDVKGAFMESPPLERKNGKVYASLPRGGIPGSTVRPDQLVEIILPLYGLNDAPQRWWSTVVEEAAKAGGCKSIFDGCLFWIFDCEKKLCGVMGHHVDDFLGGGSGGAWDQFKTKLKDRFPFRKWTEGAGTFCGAELFQLPSGEITVSQKVFAEKMKYISVPKNVKPEDPVPEPIRAQLRGVFGSGNWLGTQSRPDICAQVSLGMQQISKGTWSTVHLANNMVLRAKQEKDLCLRFKPIPMDQITAFATNDASQHNASENGTQGGYMIMFGQKSVFDGAVTPVSPWVWKSYRLRRAAGSTLSSETQACKDAVGHLVFVLNMLAEGFGGYKILERDAAVRKFGSGVIIDCKSLYGHVHSLSSPVASSSDKFTAVDFTILREVSRDSGISVRWAPGSVQVADGLTKDKEEPSLRLKGVIREGAYQLSETGECLRQSRLEKERKARLKEMRDSESVKNKQVLSAPKNDNNQKAVENAKEAEPTVEKGNSSSEAGVVWTPVTGCMATQGTVWGLLVV